MCGGAFNSGRFLPERKSGCAFFQLGIFLDDCRCFGSVLKKLMQKSFG